MRRKIHPVEAALREYQDQSRVIVDRPKFVPTYDNCHPDVKTEVECIFAGLYVQSRKFAQRNFQDEGDEFSGEVFSLHDALNDGAEPVLSLESIRYVYRGVSRIETWNPHMLVHR